MDWFQVPAERLVHHVGGPAPSGYSTAIPMPGTAARNRRPRRRRAPAAGMMVQRLGRLGPHVVGRAAPVFAQMAVPPVPEGPARSAPITRGGRPVTRHEPRPRPPPPGRTRRRSAQRSSRRCGRSSRPRSVAHEPGILSHSLSGALASLAGTNHLLASLADAQRTPRGPGNWTLIRGPGRNGPTWARRGLPRSAGSCRP